MAARGKGRAVSARDFFQKKTVSAREKKRPRREDGNETRRTRDEQVQQREPPRGAAVLRPQRRVEVRGEALVFDPVPLELALQPRNIRRHSAGGGAGGVLRPRVLLALRDGRGGGGGCVYATRSFDSLMPSLPLAKSSAKSVTPPDATLCTRNLSLHPATSAGHSRCACMMTCTICVAPGATNPVLGFTQYFFGAVVFTLNASSLVPGLYRRIVVGICFFSSTVGTFFQCAEARKRRAFDGSVSRRAKRARGGNGRGRGRDARQGAGGAGSSRREPSPRDAVPGTSGMPFSDAGGTWGRDVSRRVPNARRAIRDGRRTGTHVEI